VGIASDIAATAANREFSAAQLRDRLDNGRKIAIAILEFLDRHGVTLRRGDLRRMNPNRIGLFRSGADNQLKRDRPAGRESSPVGRPDFKSGRGRQPVFGGFDSHSLPPRSK
jgi:selenocysteine-specific elongation factor